MKLDWLWLYLIKVDVGAVRMIRHIQLYAVKVVRSDHSNQMTSIQVLIWANGILFAYRQLATKPVPMAQYAPAH